MNGIPTNTTSGCFHAGQKQRQLTTWRLLASRHLNCQKHTRCTSQLRSPGTSPWRNTLRLPGLNTTPSGLAGLPTTTLEPNSFRAGIWPTDTRLPAGGVQIAVHSVSRGGEKAPFVHCQYSRDTSSSTTTCSPARGPMSKRSSTCSRDRNAKLNSLAALKPPASSRGS